MWAGGGELGGGVFGFPSLSLRDRVQQQQGPGWHIGVGRCDAFPQVGPVTGAVGGLDADCFQELPNELPTLGTMIVEGPKCVTM